MSPLFKTLVLDGANCLPPCGQPVERAEIILAPKNVLSNMCSPVYLSREALHHAWAPRLPPRLGPEILASPGSLGHQA